MNEVTRREVIKVAAAGAALAVGAVAAQAQGGSEADRSLIYGNRGRREWWNGHWWWVMDYDHRYPNGWDMRRRCGDTGEHWILWDAIVYRKRRGFCLHLPGRPRWYVVKLVAGVTVAGQYSAEAKSFAVEKEEDMEFGPPDATRPGGGGE